MATPDFGLDVLTVGGELTPDLRIASGPIVVLDALLRRFSTPHNSWDVDRDYGCNLSQWVNETGLDVASMKARIEAECRKDERVQAATAVITEGASGEFTVSIGIRSNLGPFAFTVAVDSMNVALLSQNINTRLGF